MTLSLLLGLFVAGCSASQREEVALRASSRLFSYTMSQATAMATKAPRPRCQVIRSCSLRLKVVRPELGATTARGAIAPAGKLS